MSTTTRKTANPASMKAALKRNGVDYAAFTPKQIVEAYGSLVDGKKPAAKQPAKAPKAPATKPTPSNCGCDCGAPTITEKALFLSGHDARFAGRVGRGETKPSPAQQAIIDGSPALAAKIQGIRQTATKKAATKAARDAAKVAAKKAFDAAMAKA